MRFADAIPAFALPLREAFSSAPRGEAVRQLTGLTEEEWEEVSGRFPGLGSGAGRKAARARKAFRFLVGRALATPRHRPSWPMGVPDRAPTLYLTAHLGDLRPLRYLLRREGIAVAHILGRENLSRERIAAEDLDFDRRHPVAFPHFFAADRPHHLKQALARGSLIAVIDRVFRNGETDLEADGRYWSASFLEGFLQIDSWPLRLGALADVPVRPVFLTAPRGRLTASLGEPLPRETDRALSLFAAQLRRVADSSPHDFDGFTHRWNPGLPGGKRVV